MVTEFDPEFVNNYELPYKAALDYDLSINANLFYLDWTDMQTRGTELVSTGTFNVGESTVYGGELERNCEKADGGIFLGSSSLTVSTWRRYKSQRNSYAQAHTNQ